MNSDKKNRIGAGQESAFSKMEKVHPYRMLLYLSMAGIGVLFLILMLAYMSTRYQPDPFSVPFPKFFSISTLLLVVSSYTLSLTPKAYKKDNLKKLKRYLGLTLLFAMLFVVAQLAGWREIANSGYYFTSRASATYVYLISALHILHLLGGFVLLTFLFFKTLHASTDPVRTLIYIRDPFRRLQLAMLNHYWHFLGGLWVCLYVLFLFLF